MVTVYAVVMSMHRCTKLSQGARFTVTFVAVLLEDPDC